MLSVLNFGSFKGRREAFFAKVSTEDFRRWGWNGKYHRSKEQYHRKFSKKRHDVNWM
jgi:hypothetical protein